jgi:hypothetical protein
VSERFRNVPEQAAWLGISEKSCRRKAAAMGAYRCGSRLLFPESKTLEYLESNSLRPRRGKESRQAATPGGLNEQSRRGVLVEPRSRDGLTTGSSNIERALESLGTPADVLARHGIRVRNGMSPCPIHNGGYRTPSLSPYRGRDGKERWRCHVCDVGGDALDLQAALSGRSVKELLGDLAP